MIARAPHDFPKWGLGMFCTNPWCLLNMTVEPKDIHFGPYPDDKPLKGQGFYFYCPHCKKTFAVHESMLFTPHIEKLLEQ